MNEFLVAHRLEIVGATIRVLYDFKELKDTYRILYLGGFLHEKPRNVSALTSLHNCHNVLVHA